MKKPSRKVWRFLNSDFDSSVKLASALGISIFSARLLANRGIKDAAEARTYLYPSFDELHDPFKFNDMDKAVDRIEKAIARGEKICIYGDYDADGTTATAVLLNTFRQLNAPADFYIPDRDDGYGLSENTVKEIYENKKETKLLITVDCGINSVAPVTLANQLGMDVIVTDHHQPKKQQPPAYALISPKLPESEYPYDELAGVGLAFKLAQALTNDRAFLESQLDLVALGTVVDMVPLTGENRTLSRLGLAVLNKRERPGIHALCDTAGYGLDKTLDGTALSFRLGPRVNAAGRMDTADKAVQLLTTDSDAVATRLAQELNTANQERQALEREIQEQAVEIIENKITDDTIGIVVDSDKWGKKAPSVVGIVASRLLKTYYKPTLVIAIMGEQARGSGRCIEGMNLADALVACDNLLVKHGGHAAAAGFTVKTQNISQLREAFDAHARACLTPEMLQPKLDLEFETHLPFLTLETIKEFEQFEPFGNKNPSFVFASRRLKVSEGPRIIGQDRNHLKMKVTDGKITREALAWQAGNRRLDFVGAQLSIDLAFSPEINDWNGRQAVQLNLKDWQVGREGRGMKWDVFPKRDEPSAVKLVDNRNETKKEYLLNLLATEESCIIYVQDEEMLDLLLTKLLPESLEGIARHEATTSMAETAQLLKQLRDGQLRAIASSSTFSHREGFPYVPHFVFCHLTPSSDAFFKRCRPAFVSDRTSYLHLIYNDTDATHIHNWIAQKYPTKEALRHLYVDMRKVIQSNGGVGYPEAEMLDGKLGEALTVQTGLTIFEELRYITRQGEPGQRLIKLLPAEKSDLSFSGTYLAGEWIKQTCPTFIEFQLKANIESMWESIAHESQGTNNPDSSI
ncbi:MAG: single-stranded-DNA-specific exonuclease RecJ [Candidatus Poribacteria bacterium]|nr:single-stranded-DNA-specific exonuclease RecJ [Candidatus Poribacteria bacterium]